MNGQLGNERAVASCSGLFKLAMNVPRLQGVGLHVQQRMHATSMVGVDKKINLQLSPKEELTSPDKSEKGGVLINYGCSVLFT